MLSAKVIRQLSLASLTTLVIVTGGVSAQPPTQDGEERGQRRGPPPKAPAEALEACSDLSEGANCGFSGRRGDVNGTCIVPRNEDSVLACAPADHERN